MLIAGWARGTIASAAIGLLAACTEPAQEGPSDDGETTSPVVASSDEAESSSGEPSLPVPLVRADAWDLGEAVDDPFPGERPQFVQCELGWEVETGLFEVNTELCTYGSFVQSALDNIAEGDEVSLVLIHDALYAEEPAEAHLAIAFGDEIAWETRLPIPSEAGMLQPSWEAESDIVVGTPVTLHLHNHGTNHYRIVSLNVTHR